MVAAPDSGALSVDLGGVLGAAPGEEGTSRKDTEPQSNGCQDWGDDLPTHDAPHTEFLVTELMGWGPWVDRTRFRSLALVAP